jgi:hypothetical protein
MPHPFSAGENRMLNDTNDALGGGGSLTDQIRQIAVTGISRYVDGELSRKYPLTSGDRNITLDAEGDARPSSAPGSVPQIGAAFLSYLQDPRVLLVGAAVVASLALFFVLRK